MVGLLDSAGRFGSGMSMGSITNETVGSDGAAGARGAGPIELDSAILSGAAGSAAAAVSDRGRVWGSPAKRAAETARRIRLAAMTAPAIGARPSLVNRENGPSLGFALLTGDRARDGPDRSSRAGTCNRRAWK